MRETMPAEAARARGSRWDYYRRLVGAYLLGGTSHLTFWHERSEVNAEAPTDRLGQYYMTFAGKAAYRGPFDAQGIPLLDYRGRLGRQYNPIAIAQYGLGHYNLWAQRGDGASRAAFLQTADWLANGLEAGPGGLRFWHHHFDWPYREVLRAPWRSGLAQGQGISVLVRAAQEEPRRGPYLEAAAAAFEAFRRPLEKGGVVAETADGSLWFEEYIVQPPTHILNGFVWTLWGVRDYALATGDPEAASLFRRGLESLERCLPLYDTGYWSLYDLSATGRLRMLASPFYHRLHSVQLRATQRLGGGPALGAYADRWEGYARSPRRRGRALAEKALFKLLRY